MTIHEQDFQIIIIEFQKIAKGITLRTTSRTATLNNNLMADPKVSITFDEENNIRVLEADKYRESDQLKSQSMEFITKAISLDQTLTAITEALDSFAVKIQKEKLRALGERNKLESENENRKKKMMELNNLLNEKKGELERYTMELDSLTKVEQEQKALINKLSNSDS